MRILIAGAQDPLGRRMIDRLRTRHELLAIPELPGAVLPVPAATPRGRRELARFAQGCDAVIQIASAFSSAELPAAMSDARVKRIVRLGHLEAPPPEAPPVPTIDLRTGLLLGPGDPWGHGDALRRWAWSDDPPPEDPPAIADFRDVAGAIESALSRGQPDVVYPLLNDAPAWPALRDRIRERTEAPTGDAHPHLLGHGNQNMASSTKDIGWWHRGWDRTLIDTFATA